MTEDYKMIDLTEDYSFHKSGNYYFILNKDGVELAKFHFILKDSAIIAWRDLTKRYALTSNFYYDI